MHQVDTSSQTAAFLAGIRSYYSSFLSSPAATSLGINLAINVGSDQLASITQNLDELLPVPTASFDLNSFATNPPLTFSTPAWETEAGSVIQSQVQAAQTSAVLEAARIGQSALSTSVAIQAPTNTESGNSGPKETGVVGSALGAAAIAIGAAAVML